VRYFGMRFFPYWVALSILIIAPVSAEDFNISVGDTVSDGVPVAGAGRLASSQESDLYSFTATAGQLIFAEQLAQDAAFGNNLRWQLLRPNGLTLFSSFFNNVQGRTTLPDAGVYKVRVFTDASNPAWTGGYSFRILPIPPDQTFPLTIGETISNGVPAPGAGRLEVAGAEDRYTFNATAGDLVFFESLIQDAAFKQNLRWQLTRPNGLTLFSSFFTNPQGRVLLPDTGPYTLRIFTSGIDSEWFGDYSFRTLAIRPDQTFAYTVGTLVTNGTPAVGAGRLEDPGSEDRYTFDGDAGQIVFFESLSQAASFAQNLRWQLLGPAGQTVFSSFFSNPQGRTVLPATGQYTVRIFTSATDPDWFGDYSFRTQGVSQDQIFPYNIGTVVSDGVPAPGAGNLEDPGSQDSYTFSGTAGQTIFFQSISQAPAYQNNLRWQLIAPNGLNVFSSFFSNPQGRTILPVSGEYRIRVFTDGNQAAWVGPYSFSTRAIGDQEIPIRIGEVVSEGQPEEGAGWIEAPGSEDNYTFSALAGEVVFFEAIEQAAAFKNNLRWQLLRPSGQPVFSRYFDNLESRIVLPETGTYKIRVYTDGNDPTWIGTYSFRTFSRVFARPDNAATKPDRAVSIPVAKLLFNDIPENTTDTLQLSLPMSSTVEGGTVTLQTNSVLYSPKAGFTGQDRFTYRLLGEGGGTNDTIVQVAVTPLADDFGTVVNYKWTGNETVTVNLMAQSDTNYQLQSSPDLITWTPMRVIAGSTADPMTFSFVVDESVHTLYFRAPRATTAIVRGVE
jgi:hypothetical protein